MRRNIYDALEMTGLEAYDTCYSVFCSKRWRL